MPIKRKDFEQGNFWTRNDNFETHPLTVYLRENKDKAFTVKELKKVKTIRLSAEGIRGHLRNMVERGLVKHKQPYFIVKVSKPKRKRKVSKKRKRR